MLRTIGLHSTGVAFNLQWFYINTHTIAFVTATLYILIALATALGSRMVQQKLNIYIIFYILVYSVIAPFWLMKAIWSSVTAKKPSWR